MTRHIVRPPSLPVPEEHTLSPIGVFDWELSEPIVPIESCGRFLAVRLLVRLNGRPIAWLYLDRPGERIPVERLRRELEAQLGVAVQRSVLRRRLDASGQSVAGTAAISVVVCTRNRTDSLAHCLDSLLSMRYSSFEIIVVDNAPSTDDTAALVAALGETDARAHGVLRYVREQRPGLDWARNRGLTEAAHDIVAYTDDDVRVDPGWLGAIGRAFADEEVQLVTGLVVPAELESDAQVIFEDWYGGMGKGMRPRVFRPEWLDERARLGAHHLGVGANMALRRSWLHRLGGFDTALDVGTPSRGGGDLDIMHRTLAAGGVARYEPMAIVRHYHRRQMQALRRQLRDNGRAFGVFLLSRWRRHERPRAPVIRYAVGTWLAWLIRRVPARLRKRERLPIPLQMEELIGLVQSPWAWRWTYAHDRRLRARSSDGVPPE